MRVVGFRISAALMISVLGLVPSLAKYFQSKAIYIVRKPNGKEAVLKSTKDTEMSSAIHMGETVEAEVDSAGVMTQLKPLKQR